MNRFSKGMVLGGIVGVAGLTYAMSDKRTRKRIMRDSRKMISKAEGLAEKMDLM